MSKSEICFSKNVSRQRRSEITNCLQVREVDRHSKYLGLPTIIGRSKKTVFAAVKDRLWKKLNGWKEKLLSQAGREALIKSVLQSIPVYVMSVFRLPRGLIQELHSMLARFWWGAQGNQRKIHWKCWESLCLPKKRGGMGFRNLQVFNEALLAKQGWRLMQAPETMVARVLRNKYYRNAEFLKARLGYSPSYTWSSIWSAKALLIEGICWRIGTGCSVSVWNDVWVPDEGGSFRLPAPMPNSDPSLSVSELIDHNARTWCVDKVLQTFALSDVQQVLSIPLSPRPLADVRMWSGTKQGVYSVKSGYWLGTIGRRSNLAHGTTDQRLWTMIWQLDIPPKMRVFAWRALTGSLSVKQNLYTRNVTPSPYCDRCSLGMPETVRHALSDCQSARNIWANSSVAPILQSAPGLQLVEITQLVADAKGAAGLCDFFLHLWVAWTHRNQTIFQGKMDGQNRLLIGFHQMVQQYQHMQAAAQIKQVRSPANHSWSPPDMGSVKINTDAAMLGSEGVGLGAVIRDSYGFVLVAGVRRMHVKWEVAVAEAMAVLFGLQLAQTMGSVGIVAETDSLSTVVGLRQQQSNIYSNLSYLGAVNDDINDLLLNFPSSSCVHIGSSGNTVAHYMARLLPSSGYEEVFTVNIPSGIIALAELDV